MKTTPINQTTDGNCRATEQEMLEWEKRMKAQPPVTMLEVLAECAKTPNDVDFRVVFKALDDTGANPSEYEKLFRKAKSECFLMSADGVTARFSSIRLYMLTAKGLDELEKLQSFKRSKEARKNGNKLLEEMGAS